MYTKQEVGLMLDRERSKQKYHEQCMMEMLISVVVGAFVSMILCLVLPEIGRWSTVGYFLAFWIVSAIGVWTCLDILDRRRGGHRDAGENG